MVGVKKSSSLYQDFSIITNENTRVNPHRIDIKIFLLE